MTDTTVDSLVKAIKEHDGYIRDAIKALGGEFLERNFVEHGSWSVYYENIVKLDNRYFKITDEDPATEMQEGQDDIELELIEVDPHEVTVVEYRERPGAEKISFYTDD